VIYTEITKEKALRRRWHALFLATQPINCRQVIALYRNNIVIKQTSSGKKKKNGLKIFAYYFMENGCLQIDHAEIQNFRPYAKH